MSANFGAVPAERSAGLAQPAMIPPFQDLMLPIVRMREANGSESIPNSTFMARLAEQFQLTGQDREELLSSGKQSRFENRVYWALVHLRRAGLLESTGRGLNRITERGREILHQRPAKIDLRLLSTSFPNFALSVVRNPVKHRMRFRTRNRLPLPKSKSTRHLQSFATRSLASSRRSLRS